MKKALITIMLLAACIWLFSVSIETRPIDQETVTLLETTNLNDALQVLENLSWRYENKKIINVSDYNNLINVPIHNLTWRKALELIVLPTGLILDEKPGVIYIKNKDAIIKKLEESPTGLIDIHTKQVRISAIAFVCDKALLKSLGIDWSTLLDGKVRANINFTTTGNIPGNMLGISASPSFSVNGKTIEINTLLKVIESNQLGTVVARPQVTVSSGKKGFIQVGQDVSVKSVDEAGNTTDKFFATGVIMDVEPTVLPADTTEVVHLLVGVERSSATPGTVSTVINKSKSQTDVILYNGEETVIGGLNDTDEVKTRSGIPILKDLPWWVLGIRYLTGYYKTDKKERELTIIIKAEILPDALTRLQNKQP